MTELTPEEIEAENEAAAKRRELDAAPDEPDHLPATEMLAAAHEKYLGPDVAMHDGKPEMGTGSKFAGLHPSKKAHLAAIEHLIVVEAEHAAAEVHLTSVHTKVEHAIARVEATEEEAAKVEEPV